MPNELTKLSLFSGILGDDLASEWAGIETVCCVEIDPFCQAVIRKHYPNMLIIGDIHDVTKEKVKEVSGYEWVDIVSGGDPCQPRSIAGKRRGREDDRDLWKDMFRVIREFKPAWVVNENPTGRLTMDFHEVLSDLESAGYETRSFVIPACGVNAPHRRDRLFIVAHSKQLRRRRRANGDTARSISTLQIERPNSDAPDPSILRPSGQSKRDNRSLAEAGGAESKAGNQSSICFEARNPDAPDSNECQRQPQSSQPSEWNSEGYNQVTPDSDSRRQQQSQGNIKESGRWFTDSPRPNIADPEGKGLERAVAEGTICRRGCTPEYYPISGWQENWVEVATALCGMDDGLPHRVARLKALGNACVPQQVYPIYRAIVEVEAGSF